MNWSIQGGAAGAGNVLNPDLHQPPLLTFMNLTMFMFNLNKNVKKRKDLPGEGDYGSLIAMNERKQRFLPSRGVLLMCVFGEAGSQIADWV